MNVFIAGTDTGVGKTVVSAVLALKFRYRYWKPIQCGLLEGTDSEWVGERLGTHFVNQEAYLLNQPSSPDQAASAEGVEINVDQILSQMPADGTVIEGCGGLLVPLTDSCLLIDLIKQMGLPAILVCRTGLGTINHTLLSIEALKKRNITILGVVMSGEPHCENVRSIEKHSDVRVLAVLPKLFNFSREELLHAGSCLGSELLP